MRRLMLLTLVAILAVDAFAGSKDIGKTTLKDVQPVGTPEKKEKQQYDLSFVSTTNKEYVCRTSEKKDFKATDFVVGESVSYEVKDNKGKLKTGDGKKVECTIVRAANASAVPK